MGSFSSFAQKVNLMYRDGFKLEGNFFGDRLSKATRECHKEGKQTRKILIEKDRNPKYSRWALYSKKK